MGAAAGLVLATLALQAGQAPARNPQPLPEPLADPVRVEVRVTTTARTVRLRVLDVALLIGDARREGGGPSARVAVEGDDLVLSGNADGTAILAVYRLVVSASGATLRLTAGVSPGRTAAVDVLNLNDESRPARAARRTCRPCGPAAR
jgi:hypothetical protein